MIKKVLGIAFLLGAAYLVWSCQGILQAIMLALAGIACLTDDQMQKEIY